MFVDEEEYVEEEAAVEEEVAAVVEEEAATATEEEASDSTSAEEEAEDDGEIKPAWQTEEHHLDAHALRKQSIMTGRPNQVAWAPSPSNAWALQVPIRRIEPDYEEFDDDPPFNFITDPHTALDAMADYHNFQARMHRQLGTVLD